MRRGVSLWTENALLAGHQGTTCEVGLLLVSSMARLSGHPHSDVQTIDIVKLTIHGYGEVLARILRCYSHDPEPTPVTTVTCNTSHFEAWCRFSLLQGASTNDFTAFFCRVSAAAGYCITPAYRIEPCELSDQCITLNAEDAAASTQQHARILVSQGAQAPGPWP
jgi:hypothetical protein